MSFLLGCKTLWKLDKRIMVLNSQNPEDCWAVMYIPGRDLFIYPLTVCILGQAPVDVESIACVKESFVSECQLFPGERGGIRSAKLCFKNYRPPYLLSFPPLWQRRFTLWIFVSKVCTNSESLRRKLHFLKPITFPYIFPLW